jgi:hypothetical protein
MNTVYNSSYFCVIQFSDFGDAEQHPAGGFEIMDKAMRREIFLGGKEAERFREEVSNLISSEPSVDEVDAFLAGYSSLMNQPTALH